MLKKFFSLSFSIMSVYGMEAETFTTKGMESALLKFFATKDGVPIKKGMNSMLNKHYPEHHLANGIGALDPAGPKTCGVFTAIKLIVGNEPSEWMSEDFKNFLKCCDVISIHIAYQSGFRTGIARIDGAKEKVGEHYDCLLHYVRACSVVIGQYLGVNEWKETKGSLMTSDYDPTCVILEIIEQQKILFCVEFSVKAIGSEPFCEQKKKFYHLNGQEVKDLSHYKEKFLPLFHLERVFPQGTTQEKMQQFLDQQLSSEHIKFFALAVDIQEKKTEMIGKHEKLKLYKDLPRNNKQLQVELQNIKKEILQIKETKGGTQEGFDFGHISTIYLTGEK